MATKKKEGGDKLSCSFCGKSQDIVKKLVAGPGVYICDECIELCNEIVSEDFESTSIEKNFGNLPKPHQIKEILDQYVVGQEDAKKIVGCGL